MRYLGGKSRLAANIAPVLERLGQNSTGRYVEPFVGGGSVLEAVCNLRYFDVIEAGDLHIDLIHLWRALQAGWEPPAEMSYDEWWRLKHLKTPSALRGFAGFGASFGGIWFAGYARSEVGVEDGRTIAASRRCCIRQGLAMRGVRFRHRSFDAWSLCEGDVVYCDPPYADTAGYRGLAEQEFDTPRKRSHDRQQRFNSSYFWAWCQSQTDRGVRVIVSEFTGPPMDGWVRAAVTNRDFAFNHSKKEEAGDALFIHERFLGLVL